MAKIGISGVYVFDKREAQLVIGLPVYNGASKLAAVLDSLLNQSWREYTLVISDNASTDETTELCRAYAERDSRVVYIRQPENIGPDANFRFVFNHIPSEFFMWAAADDLRSLDFLERNMTFLLANPEFVGSTCPVRFEGRNNDSLEMGDFSLDHPNPHQRLLDFFSGWHANGRFYSILRREAVKDWVDDHGDFLAADWTMPMTLARKGKLKRLDEGWLELGRGGISNKSNIFKRYREGVLEWILPLHRVSRIAIGMMAGGSLRQRTSLFWRISLLNARAFLYQLIVAYRRREL